MFYTTQRDFCELKKANGLTFSMVSEQKLNLYRFHVR